jgi:hypothetical protein
VCVVEAEGRSEAGPRHCRCPELSNVVCGEVMGGDKSGDMIGDKGGDVVGDKGGDVGVGWGSGKVGDNGGGMVGSKGGDVGGHEIGGMVGSGVGFWRRRAAASRGRRCRKASTGG